MPIPLNVTVLDPGSGPTTERVQLAPRPETLSGLTVGVIWNNRPLGDRIIRMVIELLQARFQLEGVVFLMKPFHGNVAPDEMYDEVARQCHFAITGVGD